MSNITIDAEILADGKATTGAAPASRQVGKPSIRRRGAAAVAA
jgi:hypothetical protein